MRVLQIPWKKSVVLDHTSASLLQNPKKLPIILSPKNFLGRFGTRFRGIFTRRHIYFRGIFTVQLQSIQSSNIMPKERKCVPIFDRCMFIKWISNANSVTYIYIFPLYISPQLSLNLN